MKRLFTILLSAGLIVNVIAQQTFTNFQNASLVIGQPDFQAQITNLSDSILRGPSFCAISSKGMLAVAEQGIGDVKIWYKLPTVNGQPADIVVGNPDFNTVNSVASQSSISGNCNGVAWSPDGNKLIAGDYWASRILIWNTIPTTNGQPADVVIGQTDFTSSTSGTSDTKMDRPLAIMVSPDGKLFVADYFNNRVLIWNTIPETNGAPADVVIGQQNFFANVASTQPDGLNRPWGINYSPDGRLLISNVYGHNVFVYDSIPTTNGESATVVIGHNQFGLTSSGLSDTTLNLPIAAAVTPDGKVAIGEFGNHRVIIYDSVPRTNGARANVVLGQPDFFTNIAYAPAGIRDTNNFNTVYNVSTDLNGRLFVAGREMNRVMVFGELPSDSADIGISISESSTALCDSSDVVYRIKIQNPGPDSAKNVISTTAFPDGYTINSVNVADGSYNQVSGYWKIPYIAPDDSAILTINGIVDAGMAGRTITTYANIINSSAIDTNLNNNGTSVSVTVSMIIKPEDPVADDTITCSGTSAVLTATGTGTLYWYANADDVIPLDTGAIYNTVPLLASATFYVEANNGCPSSNRTPVNVDLYPAYNMADTVIVCSGDSYTFPDGSTQNNITATVIYTSYLTTVNGCDSIIETTIFVNPVYSLQETVTICSGSSYTFPDNTTQDSITAPVVYTSYLTTIEGCDSIIETTVNVNPVYNEEETIFVCRGDSYTFPDGTTQDNITTADVYTSSLTTVNGCDSIILTIVNVTSINVSVTQNGSTMTADAAGLDYQWIDCDNENSPLSGEVNQTFTAAADGNYAVIVFENGCSDTSACFSVSMIGVNENDYNNELSIYPNPTDGKIAIDFKRFYNNIVAEVVNLQGLVILRQSFDYEHKTIELDLTEFEPGIYIIKLTTIEKTTLLRVLKE